MPTIAELGGWGEKTKLYFEDLIKSKQFVNLVVYDGLSPNGNPHEWPTRNIFGVPIAIGPIVNKLGSKTGWGLVTRDSMTTWIMKIEDIKEIIEGGPLEPELPTGKSGTLNKRESRIRGAAKT